MAPVLCLALLSLLPARSAAQGPGGLLAALQAFPAVSGYEDSLRAAVVARLPAWCRPQRDSLGSVTVDLGGRGPVRLVAAPLDEPGYVVTDIDTSGYLRLSRLAGWGRLFDQFHSGQRFQILTSRGPLPAVMAAPSIHLRRGPSTEIAGASELWLDGGFTSAQEAGRAGVGLLDPITLVERWTPLAGGRAAGPGLEGRAEVAALLGALGARGAGKPPAARAHWVVAFTAQAQPGGRGLRRLLRRFAPAEVYLLGGFPRAVPGAGPAVWSDSLRGLAPELARKVQRLGAHAPQRQSLAYAPDQAGLDPLARVPAAVLGLPVRYARTPSEMVDEADVVALSDLLRRLWESP